MKSLLSKCKEILVTYRRAPRMCASVKESYVFCIAILLDLLEVEPELVRKFIYESLDGYGSLLRAPLELVDDDWAHQVVDKANQLIDDHVSKTENRIDSDGDNN